MKGPQWQRALLLKDGPTQIVAGGLCFVRRLDDGQFESNVLNAKGKKRLLYSDFFELLARDESDFTDDPPFIPWEDFLASCRTSKQSQS